MIPIKTNTATWICVGPALDKTDGITPETAITIANARTTFVKETDDGAAPTLILDNVAGDNGTNTLVHITSEDAGYYYLKLTAANVNWMGRGKLTIVDVTTYVTIFHEIEIVSAEYWNMKYGTTPIPANLTQIGADAQSLADFKDFVDAGYDPETNKVEGVKLVDVTTVSSNMRGTDGALTSLPDYATETNAIANKNELSNKIDNIPSVTHYVETDLPAELKIPTAGEGVQYTKVNFFFRDTNGDLVDPEDEQDPAPGASVYDGFGAKCTDSDGVMVALYQNNSGTPLTLHSVHHTLDGQEFKRTAAGSYYCWVKRTPGIEETQLTFKVAGWRVADWNGGVYPGDHIRDMFTTSLKDNTGILGAIDDAQAAIIAEVDANETKIDAILDDTGTSGVVVASDAKSGYSLSTAPPTVEQIRAELEGAGSSLAAIVEGTTVTIPGLIAVLNNLSEAGVLEQVIAGFNTAKPGEITPDSAYEMLESGGGGASAEEVEALLSANHGAGLWGAASEGDVVLTQATENTDGDTIGITTAGATITAYLRSDTARATPLRQATAEVDGQWQLAVSPSAEYTLVFSRDGFNEHTEEVDVA